MRPPEEIRREHMDQWLARANEDFELAGHLVSENSPYLNAICFHAQQAAEKYLKAFLVYKQVEFPKTHDLVKILDLIATVNRPLAESLHDVKGLSNYGVDIRYPGDLPEISNEDARQALKLAEKARDAITSAL